MCRRKYDFSKEDLSSPGLSADVFWEKRGKPEKEEEKGREMRKKREGGKDTGTGIMGGSSVSDPHSFHTDLDPV
jgi:hypothetical protein